MAAEILKCVQCDSTFKPEENIPGACSFHKTCYTNYGSYMCCGKDTPCELNRHRTEHHMDYVYGAFIDRANSVTQYSNTTNEWETLEQSYEDNTEKVFVGELLRWTTNSVLITEPLIVLQVGILRLSGGNYFNTFSGKDLVKLAAGKQPGEVIQIAYSGNNERYSKAEWVVGSEGKINQIKISIQVDPVEGSYSRLIEFNPDTLQIISKKVLSDGLVIYKSKQVYVLPPLKKVGSDIFVPKYKAKQDFRTQGDFAGQVLLSVLECKANPQHAHTDCDLFVGEVSCFNHSESGNTAVIAIIKAEYRLIGDEYQSCEIETDLKCPFAVENFKSQKLRFTIKVPRTEADAKLQIKWWDRALVARDRPLRVKITFQNHKGQNSSIIYEYVLNHFKYETKNDEDLAFIYLDDPFTCTRVYVRAKVDSDSTLILENTGLTFTKADLNKLVLRAKKEGVSQINLECNSKRDETDILVWALVDMNCNKVYAFKVQLASKIGAALGYVPVPSYSNTEAIMDISYASETDSFPNIRPPEVVHYAQEDNLDLNTEPPSISEVKPASKDVQLSSLNDRIDRLTVAVEKIASLMERFLDSK
ncbi:hypothetical protein HDV04_002907 [Boothiomyces sp. JEL0838]|nr:hypothetical protein HDV04_002907 [Boothiomyces sp. JEL0838]